MFGGDYNIFPILKNRILDLSKESNLKNTPNRRDKNKKWFVSLPKVRGHIEFKRTDRMVTEDFYSPFPRDIKPVQNIDPLWIKQKQRNWYGFDTYDEALNFIEFLKTRWAMFCLSLNKFNQNVQEKEAESIPWLNWSEAWSEERFEKLINATTEEIEFVYKNIPNYYNL